MNKYTSDIKYALLKVAVMCIGAFLIIAALKGWI